MLASRTLNYKSRGPKRRQTSRQYYESITNAELLHDISISVYLFVRVYTSVIFFVSAMLSQ